MKKNIIIVILVILIIGLSGYILYDKSLSQDTVTNDNNNTETNNNNNETGNNTYWLDYLLDQEFVSATLMVCSIDDKYVYAEEEQPNPGVGRNLTKEELKTILNSIDKADRENSYGKIVKVEGYATPACEENIIYKYTRDNKEYQLKLVEATTIISDDETFMEVLENQISNYPYYGLNQDNSNYKAVVKDMMKQYIK